MRFTLKEWNKIWEMLATDKMKLEQRIDKIDTEIKEYAGEETDEKFKWLTERRKKYNDELNFVKDMLRKIDTDEI